MYKTKMYIAYLLSITALFAWAVSHEVAYAGEVPPPEIISGPCASKSNKGGAKLSPQELSKIAQQKTSQKAVSQPSQFIDPIPVDNCTKTASCRNIGCRDIRGGSQRVFSNGIPSCERDPNPKCFTVYCVVYSYGTRKCQGEPIDDSPVPMRGCRMTP